MIVARVDPGRRRRRAAAGVRHHPRRVPAGEGGRRGRRDRRRSSPSVPVSAWSWPGRSWTRSSYHWLFWLPLVVLVIAALAAQFLVPESPVRTPGSINWPAALLLSAGWSRCCWPSARRRPGAGARRGCSGCSSPPSSSPRVGASWSPRRAQPLIDMRMMRVRAVWATNLVALLFGVAMYAAFAFLPQFLQTPAAAGYGFGSTVTESGLLLLPQTSPRSSSAWSSGTAGAADRLQAGAAHRHAGVRRGLPGLRAGARLAGAGAGRLHRDGRRASDWRSPPCRT